MCFSKWNVAEAVHSVSRQKVLEWFTHSSSFGEECFPKFFLTGDSHKEEACSRNTDNSLPTYYDITFRCISPWTLQFSYHNTVQLMLPNDTVCVNKAIQTDKFMYGTLHFYDNITNNQLQRRKSHFSSLFHPIDAKFHCCGLRMKAGHEPGYHHSG